MLKVKAGTAPERQFGAAEGTNVEDRGFLGQCWYVSTSQFCQLLTRLCSWDLISKPRNEAQIKALRLSKRTIRLAGK